MLNAADYYKDRDYITTSMALSFRRSRALYARRFIENAERELTASMKIGSYVDDVVTGGVTEVSLTPSQKRTADGFIAAYRLLPIFPELEAAKKQVILTGKFKNILFKGKPDFCLPTATVDLKISSTAKVDRWYWNCLGRGLDLQAGVYTELRRQAGEKVLPFYHLVGWEEEGICRFRLFRLPASMVKNGLKKFKRIAQDIRACDDFTDPPVTFETAEKLLRPGFVDVEND